MSKPPEYLLLDIRRKIALETSYNELDNVCNSSDDLRRICSAESFWVEYNQYQYMIKPSLYLEGYSGKQMAELINKLLQGYFKVGSLPSVDSFKNIFTKESLKKITDDVIEFPEFFGENIDLGNAIIKFIHEWDPPLHHRFVHCKLFIPADEYTLKIPYASTDFTLPGRTENPIHEFLQDPMGRKIYGWLFAEASKLTKYYSSNEIIEIAYDPAIVDQYEYYIFDDNIKAINIRNDRDGPNLDSSLHDRIRGYGDGLYYSNFYSIFDD